MIRILSLEVWTPLKLHVISELELIKIFYAVNLQFVKAVFSDFDYQFIDLLKKFIDSLVNLNQALFFVQYSLHSIQLSEIMKNDKKIWTNNGRI